REPVRYVHNDQTIVRTVIQLAHGLVLALAFFAFAAWVSTRYALNAGRFRSLGLGVSRTWPLLSLPLGFGLLTLMLLLQGPWPRQPASTTVEGGSQA
ncbi:hypothetical protein ACLBVD_18535, partial [Pseudomonas aeruginosa]